jgi:hypothetical protein
MNALAELEPWLSAGAQLDGLTPGAVLAARLDLSFRADAVGAVLVARYGGSENGLVLMLKSLIAGIHAAPALVPGVEEQVWIDNLLSDAWNAMSAVGVPASWPLWYRNNSLDVDLPVWLSLEGFESLQPTVQVPAGVLRSVEPGTLFSPLSAVYTQFVSPGAGDSARSSLPVGSSELAGPYALNQLPLWLTEDFKPSPRSLAGVAAMGPSTLTELEFQP